MNETRRHGKVYIYQMNWGKKALTLSITHTHTHLEKGNKSRWKYRFTVGFWVAHDQFLSGFHAFNSIIEMKWTSFDIFWINDGRKMATKIGIHQAQANLNR